MPVPHSIALAAISAKLRARGAEDATVATFHMYVEQVIAGGSPMISEDDIEPHEDLPSLNGLRAARLPADRELLNSCCVIRLNGGLGTTMGLNGPKSLIPVRGGQTFLDVAARQVAWIRGQLDIRLPLILMNSPATESAMRDHWPVDDGADVPLSFTQGEVPRLDAQTLMPVECSGDRSAEWCPPGHGDIYASLWRTGLLESLLQHGYRYAFIANSDNLGAVWDSRIPVWMSETGRSFVAEQTLRVSADRKGGHLARSRDGGAWILRESAQTEGPPAERHRTVNINNIHIDLRALHEELTSRGGVLPLALIINRKSVRTNNLDRVDVLQLETAMASAIQVLADAAAIMVPRSRFAPVKTTDDLLVVRSDWYRMTDAAELLPADAGVAPPFVQLDPGFYGKLGDFDARFPDGPPSLRSCTSLCVRGDVLFKGGVVAQGDVTVVNSSDAQITVDSATDLSALG